MKNIILLVIIVTLASCEKFLDVIPKTLITDANFYTNQTDFEQAVNASYQPLQSIYNSSHWQLNELRSDNTYFMYNVQNRGTKVTEDIATFTVLSNSIPVQDNWLNNYLIISRVNNILQKIENVSFESSLKNNLKGQALFLRALAYFDLVKNFGGVPLCTELVTTYSEAFKERSDKEEVYNQIINDLKLAVELLPEKNSQIKGKATSGAAYTLLADVYITLKQWTDAKLALEEVMDMGYSLLPKYEDIFKPTNKYNNELIFEISYITGTAQPLYSTFPYSFLPDLENPSVITGVTPATRAGGGLNTPTPDLLRAYEDTLRDARYEASIGFYTGTSPRQGVYYNHTPYIKKYLHPHAVQGQTDQNWPVYRYAEVLLMYAEVLNELDNLNDAQLFLNLIRNRAGLSDTTAFSKSELRDIIFHERQIEFAFENKRWHDLVRSGKAVEVMNSFGSKVKNDPQAYYYPTGVEPTEAAFNVKEHMLVYPIPLRDIIVNPNLIQNPGY